jgi:hypothetical protein
MENPITENVESSGGALSQVTKEKKKKKKKLTALVIGFDSLVIGFTFSCNRVRDEKLLSNIFQPILKNG